MKKVAALTKREKEIVELLIAGNSSQQVARQKLLSVHTVNTHRKRIYEKLAIQNLAGLMKYADFFELSAI